MPPEIQIPLQAAIDAKAAADAAAAFEQAKHDELKTANDAYTQAGADSDLADAKLEASREALDAAIHAFFQTPPPPHD